MVGTPKYCYEEIIFILACRFHGFSDKTILKLHRQLWPAHKVVLAGLNYVWSKYKDDPIYNKLELKATLGRSKLRFKSEEMKDEESLIIQMHETRELYRILGVDTEELQPVAESESDAEEEQELITEPSPDSRLKLKTEAESEPEPELELESSAKTEVMSEQSTEVNPNTPHSWSDLEDYGNPVTGTHELFAVHSGSKEAAKNDKEQAYATLDSTETPVILDGLPQGGLLQDGLPQNISTEGFWPTFTNFAHLQPETRRFQYPDPQYVWPHPYQQQPTYGYRADSSYNGESSSSGSTANYAVYPHFAPWVHPPFYASTSTTSPPKRRAPSDSVDETVDHAAKRRRTSVNNLHKGSPSKETQK